MRIVSLLPSATEMVCALGLADDLVARSPECDYPAEVLAKPIASKAYVDPRLPSAQIDAEVEARVRAGQALYEIDEALLRKLKPDLLLTQGICAVCAPGLGTVEEVVDRLPFAPQVLSLDTHTLEGILEDLVTVGKVTGREAEARSLRKRLLDRLAEVRSRVRGPPREVFCMEWLDPVFNAGHWVPEQVEAAGGVDRLAVAGEPSRKVPWDALVEYDPDHLVLMPCGMDVERGLKEVPAVSRRKEWASLHAVMEGNVWLANGSAYFNRPGPRVVRGVEILACILHPEAFEGPPDAADARRVT